MATPLEFAAALLDRLGLARTQNRLKSIVLFAAKEGGHWGNGARYNPMNTCESAPGAQPWGGPGCIKKYPDWATGVAATAQTIGQSNMRPIADALRADATPYEFLTAVTATPWCPQSSPSCGNYATGNLDALYNSYANRSDSGVDLATTPQAIATLRAHPIAAALVATAAALGIVYYFRPDWVRPLLKPFRRRWRRRYA